MASANAAAVTMAIVYVVCRTAFAVLPELSLSIARSWFHSITLNQTTIDLSTDSFILGIVSVTIGAWLVGYIFAISYNAFTKK